MVNLAVANVAAVMVAADALFTLRCFSHLFEAKNAQAAGMGIGAGFAGIIIIAVGKRQSVRARFWLPNHAISWAFGLFMARAHYLTCRCGEDAGGRRGGEMIAS